MTKKTLSKILEGYLDDYMTPDSQKFIQSHTVAMQKGDEKVGTSDDKLFKASNIKQTKLGGSKKEHGYKNPEDEKAYDPHIDASKPVKEEKHHNKDCECEKCENDRDEMKEETHSPEDLHFKKQTKKMQDAINLHLRKGKDYNDAVKAAKMHVKEESEQIDEISNRAKSAYLGTAVADLTARSQEHGYNRAKKKKDIGDNARKIMNRQDGIYRATKGMREEADQIAEKTLTPAEIKKREEIAKAIERKNPDMAMGKKMAIATAAAKRVAEQIEIEEAGMPASVIKSKQDLANMSDAEFAKKHGNKSEKELRDMAARHGYGWNKATKTGSDHYVKRVAAGLKEDVELDEAKRGRPSKTNPEQNIEPIQTQLQKMHKQNEVDVTFADKSKHTIPREHANKALKHLSSLKPIHRDEAQKQMSSSKQGFYDALAGKKQEAKPKITLAKLKTMKESTAAYELAMQKQMMKKISPEDRDKLIKLGTMGIKKKEAAPPSDEAREKKAGGGDD